MLNPFSTRGKVRLMSQKGTNFLKYIENCKMNKSISLLHSGRYCVKKMNIFMNIKEAKKGLMNYISI